MGLLSNLMSKIFGHSGATIAATGGASAAPAAAPSTAGAQPTPPPAAAPPPAASAAPPKVVDVAAILDGLAAKNPEKLDWKKSIVDLMKLVGMDSSFKARKQLAKELNYTGDPNDSASMNIWLHKQVLRKIAENGGKVPQELLS
jgi:pyruvate/2-oxoglutarate dehydrogenase complex dihydrolipoamide acyltransferase (E2) component